MKRAIYLNPVLILTCAVFCALLHPNQVYAQAQPDFVHDGMNMPSRVPIGSVPASSLDFTKNQDYSGIVSLPIPLVSLGGVSVELKYYSKDVSTKVRTENRYAPSGSYGFGWQLLYGSISGEINGSADTSDDTYFYNGPDGSFQLQEGPDGIFRIPNYRPWKIQRNVSNGMIISWTITKEDGTVLTFGNYGNSTYATRYFLGYNGVVCNPGTALYSGLTNIPYQWDLSDVRDVEGNQTTLMYQQVDLPLTTADVNSALLYTRESHLSQILDNKGNEIDFQYSAMNSNEFYSSYSSFEQNLVDTLYLNTIYLKGNNGQTYKKIVLSYQSTDILGLGITKRYLTGLTFCDPSGNSLPSYSFAYNGSGNVDPGSLMSVTSPDGGTVTYAYQTQSLTNFQLSKAAAVNSIDYYDPILSQPKDDGLAGKDFVLTRSTDHTISVYRQGPTGWFLDRSFPFDNSDFSKVSNDFVVLHDLTSGFDWAVKRTQEGWRKYCVDSAVTAKIGTFSGPPWVVGVGPNYFVVQYDQGGGPSVYSWQVAIIMFSPTKLIVYPLSGTYYDGSIWTRCDGSTGEISSMRAFCGENYMVLASASSDGGSTLFSHLRYSATTGQWTQVGSTQPVSGYELDTFFPDRVYIGKNFVVVAINTGSCSGATSGAELKVYRRDSLATDLAQVDDINVSHECGNIVIGDDYYAYAYNDYDNTAPMDQIVVRVWHNGSFSPLSSTYLTSINQAISGHGSVSLTAMDNRLVLDWWDGSYWKAGFISYTPAANTWSSGYTFHQQSSSILQAQAQQCAGLAINQNTFVEMCYGTSTDLQNVPEPNLILVHGYQFHGDGSVSYATVDSIWTERWFPWQWIWQTGSNFFALARGEWEYSPGESTGDTLSVYTLNNVPDGSLQFNGSPTVPVVYQKTYASGMGDHAVYTYSFQQVSGVMNEYLTPEYGSVTETLPGSNGQIETYYHIDSLLSNGTTFSGLDGLPYDVKELASQGGVVRETQSVWDAVDVDAADGVFDQELASKTSTLDGVSKTTSYSYDGSAGAYELSTTTDTNSDGTQRITRMMRPLDYSVTGPGGDDAMTQALYYMQQGNDINPIIDKWVVQNAAGTKTVLSSEITEYSYTGLGQILPSERLRLALSSPTPLSSFDSSYVMYGTNFILPNHAEYITTEAFNSYDAYGNLLESTDANGNITENQYGYHHSGLMGVVRNSGGGTSIFDDFNDGSITDGDPFTWTTTNSWSVSNGTLVSNGGGYAANTNVTFQNFTVDVRLQMLNDDGNSSNWSAVYFGSTGNNPWSTGGYLVYYRYNGEIDLWSNATQNLATVSTGLSPTTWRRLTVYVNGLNVRVFVDGQLFINYTLPSAPSAGCVALYALNNTTEFDDFRCYPYGGIAYSYGYDPATLYLTNRNGPNNIPTFYTYDGFGRLAEENGGQGDLLKDYSYYYSRSGNGNVFNSSDPNYDKEVSYRSPTDSTVSKTYIDGLGRKVEKEISEGGGNDIITYTYYDSLNRVSRQYKPFEYANNENFFVDYYGQEVNSTDASYYNNNVYDGFSDSYPYSTNIYNQDPVGRLEDFVPPGSTWQTHPIASSYGTNSAQIGDYPTGTLYSTTTTNENYINDIVYKDLFGNLVEKVTDSGGKKLTTDYTYDVLGHPTSSTPPKGISYASHFTYNTLGELASQTSPDAGTTNYLYDANGNLRFEQDANHSGTANSVNCEGVLIGTDSHQGPFTLTMPGQVGISLSNYGASTDNITGKIETTGGVVIVSYQVTGSTVNGSTSIYLPKGTYQYVVTSTSSEKDYEFDYDFYCSNDYEMKYRKYDPLNRLIEKGVLLGTTASGDFNQADADSVNVPNQNHGYSTIFRRAYFYDTPSPDANVAGQTNILGRLSYTQAYDANGNVERTTSYSYDDMGRIDWIVIDGATWYPKKITYSYDLQGNLVQRGDVDSDWRAHPFYWNYSYDVAGRLSNVQTNANGSLTQEGASEYFANGESKQLALGPGPVSTVTYHYNQRDWLEYLSSGQYYENIGYDNTPGFATPQFNGNISFVIYNFNGLNYYTDQSIGLTSPASAVGYAYYYDSVNRLTKASFYPYSGGWLTSNSYGVTGIGYDNDGNLMTLERYQSDDQLEDNLTYNYGTGDEVSSITNSVGPSSSYTYDSNGNVISDSKDSIGFTLYDIYDEPVALFMTNGAEYTYAYDVDGTRIWKNSGGGPSYEFYVNDPDGKTIAINLQPYSQDVDYNVWAGNDNIAQVRYDNASGYSYYYFLKDHLGNIKMILNDSGGVDSYNNYYPFGEQMPGTSPLMNQTGSADTRYKFTGKEEDPETALYYFGARYYDPWSGRFNSVDPMAGKYPGFSPYDYAVDNPLAFADPNGMDAGPLDLTAPNYAIDGITVSQEMFESAYAQRTNSPQLTIQHQAYQDWENMLNSAGDFAKTIPSLSSFGTPDMSSPTVLTLGIVGMEFDADQSYMDRIYLMATAGGESGANVTEMAQWMYVILNRSAHDKASIMDVVTKPGQFYGLTRSKAGPAILNGGGGATRKLALEAYIGVISGAIPNLIRSSRNAGSIPDWNGKSPTFAHARDIYLTQIAAGMESGTIAFPKFFVKFIGASVFFNNPY